MKPSRGIWIIDRNPNNNAFEIAQCGASVNDSAISRGGAPRQ